MSKTPSAPVPMTALNQDNDDATVRLQDEQTGGIPNDEPAIDTETGLPEGFGKPHTDAEQDTSIQAQAQRATEENESEQRVPLARVREITRQKHEALDRERARNAENDALRAELEALRKPNVDRDFDTEEAELAKKYADDDDMDHDTFLAQLKELSKERGRAEQAATSFAESQKAAAEAINRDWSAAEAAFLEVNPIYTTNEAYLAALNAYVPKVAAADRTLTPDEIMDEAHKLVTKDLGATELTQKQLVERARLLSAATAAAATATLPAMPQGGVGSRSTGSEVDMEVMTPERWAKMSKADREQQLGIVASA